jgi:putative spermidine/putrescine transport system ATP-binding protein
MTNPRVLLLDEPLSALDEYLRLRMRGELRRVQKELGITFIHVTHTQLEAIAVADMVVVMEQGRIEQAGTPREIYTAPRNAYVARFIGGQNVMSGAVEGLANGLATAVGHSGSRLLIPIGESQVAKGSVVFASTRRDRIELTRLAAGAKAELEANTVAGEVHAIEYQGSYVKVTIDLEAPEEFVANVTDEEFFREPLEIGDRVLARWSANDVRILEGNSAAGGAAAARPYGSP